MVCLSDKDIRFLSINVRPLYTRACTYARYPNITQTFDFANCFPLTTHILVLQTGKQCLGFARGWVWCLGSLARPAPPCVRPLIFPKTTTTFPPFIGGRSRDLHQFSRQFRIPHCTNIYSNGQSFGETHSPQYQSRTAALQPTVRTPTQILSEQHL